MVPLICTGDVCASCAPMIRELRILGFTTIPSFMYRDLESSSASEEALERPIRQSRTSGVIAAACFRQFRATTLSSKEDIQDVPDKYEVLESASSSETLIQAPAGLARIRTAVAADSNFASAGSQSGAKALEGENSKSSKGRSLQRGHRAFLRADSLVSSEDESPFIALKPRQKAPAQRVARAKDSSPRDSSRSPTGHFSGHRSGSKSSSSTASSTPDKLEGPNQASNS